MEQSEGHATRRKPQKCTGPAAVFHDDRIKWRELARKLDTVMNRMKFMEDEQETMKLKLLLRASTRTSMAVSVQSHGQSCGK